MLKVTMEHFREPVILSSRVILIAPGTGKGFPMDKQTLTSWKNAGIAIILGVVCMSGCGTAGTPDYPIRPVPFTDVEIDDSFWSPRMETNREVTIPYALQMCEETGRIDNFAIAGGLMEGSHQGYYFNDSDVAKVIEGAAYSLALYPDPELEAYVDDVIDKIAAAQEEDGYLYTARTAMTPDHLPPGGEKRWSNIEHGHELYNLGHMIEGAIAYYLATDKRLLLDVVLRSLDLVEDVFGPDGMRNPSGHQEIEIALGKLYRLTGEPRYLNLAKFFLDMRGDAEGHELYGEYSQDHIPVTEQTRAVGHSVRAAYLYSGMADIAALTGDDRYVKAIDAIWQDVVSTKLYVTGGIGATGGNEGFSTPYALPNETAYSETCASIANAMWNHRTFLLHGDARYMDIAERVIYNAFLSGISLEGDRFFYPNRLATVPGEERAPWFPCACCPSNVVRFLPSLPGYIYAHAGSDLYVNLFISGTGTVRTDRGTVRISQESRYPWDGRITIRVVPERPSGKYTLHLRIPGWARNEVVPSDLYRFTDQSAEEPVLLVNGELVPLTIENGYATIRRRWREGDEVVLDLPMPIRTVVAHENVVADRGRLSLQRGPLVYCVEWLDSESGDVQSLVLPVNPDLKTEDRAGLLGGIQVLRGVAGPWAFEAIPYFAWAHRGMGEMAVWLPAERR